MKKYALIITALAIIVAGCKKFDEVGANEPKGSTTTTSTNGTFSTITSMADLDISSNFSWRTIKTVSVLFNLPTDGKLKTTRIYSPDGEKLFFKGYPEDGSRTLSTLVTVPTYIKSVLVKYGDGTDVPITEISVSEVDMSLNMAALKSASFKTAGSGNCDSDTDPNITTFGGFKFEYKNMSNNIDGTSTWTYKVTGVAPGGPTYKDLSHWVLALCNNHSVTVATGNFEVVNDPTLNVYGLKWDDEINKSGGTETFAFTLDGHYEVDDIEVAFKAGQNLFYCTIPGPGCAIDDGSPDFDCLTMWALDDNNPGNLYYVTLSDPVTVHTEGDIEGLLDDEDMESLAIDSNGDMYFINVKTSSKLYKIPFSEVDKDASTPVNATYIGNTGITGNDNKITNLTFIDGDLYGIGVRSEKVYRIDKTDGSATHVATLDRDFWTSGLTKAADGTVYLLYTKVNGQESELWKFTSFANGEIEKVMNIEGSLKVESLAAHPNGFLYAADDYKFFKLDPINETTEVLVEYESDMKVLIFTGNTN
jgi:hypothetical protein